MTPQMLQTFTATLTGMMEQTLAKMRDSAGDLAGEEFLPPDIADRATMESGRNFALLMRDRDRLALSGIREALSRLEAGEYGLCEECGEDIAEARLRAQPMATLCVHCKSLREDEERLRPAAASGFFQA
ncbi:TraR/DksA family transcriptional regulator [Fundidesulfovibrio terrae]|uniref:TraR/DksA family transcriptional regulator n=1 Tax=Fundidesulfovibrio terrae TaxID=2922866 RepID=UPI001FAF3D1E|nr:TraR/DksA C4-type zinc finger protein [Fundidesulfovibrio terrae]